MNKHFLSSAIATLLFAVVSNAQFPQTLVTVTNTDNITIALFGITGQSGLYYRVGPNGLRVVKYADNTVKLIGSVVNKNNNSQRFDVDFTLINRRTGTQWQAMGEMLMSDPAGCNPINPADITVYQIASGISTLTGVNAFAGKVLNINELNFGSGPKKNFIQIGDKAGVINCGDGLAAWFGFTGTHTSTSDWFTKANIDPAFLQQNPNDPCFFKNTPNITLALFGIPGQSDLYYAPDANGLKLIPINGNTAKLEGIIVNKANPNQRFMVDYTLVNPKTGAQWIADGNMVMTDNVNGCFPVDPSDWAIWEIQSGTSTLTGLGAFAGINLSVFEIDYGGGPKKNFLQYGDGAGVIACGLGIALWYALQGNGITATSDFYSLLDCPNNGGFVNRCNASNSVFAKQMFNIKSNGVNKKYLPASPGSVKFTRYPDGTASIIGPVVNINDPSDTWNLKLLMNPPKTYADWVNLGGKAHTSCPTADVNTWEIFPLLPGTLTGTGANAGQVINIKVVSGYGMQYGIGGSGKCGNAMGTWVRYSGSVKGRGDFHIGITDCGFVPCTGSDCSAHTIHPLQIKDDKIEEEVDLPSGLVAYPNPVTAGKINVVLTDTDESEAKITIRDLSGRIIFISKANLVNGQAVEINISGLVPGTYILSASGEEMGVQSVVIVVR